ncbi:DUF1707 domain-containing protein [Agromyces sp. H66]|uniref:DUF1707 SHOCT-like domain-containing protein n=1 Tax=Agromyces sp. H66 TaxID=2529859 RepID=UPI0010AA6508|nr:DUF1707 domain-containing protein [Agromyces sp. H66]
MSGYANPDRPDLRLSDAERDEAVGALAAARTEGRLAETEYQERASAVRRAVTRGDLMPLFADLPDSAPAEQQLPQPTTAVPGPMPAAPPVPPAPPAPAAPITGYGADAYREPRGSRALGGRIGDTIMALTPFLAVGLFFLFGFAGYFAWSWLWFFIIPVAAIIIYGPGGDSRRSG